MTNTLTISREMIERIVKDGAVSVAQLDQMRQILAAPVVERQEPVAWRFRVSDTSVWFTTTRKDVAEMFRKSPDGSHSEPLYTSPPAPVAVVLPERKTVDVNDGALDNARKRGYNACIDDTRELNACLDKVKEMNR